MNPLTISIEGFEGPLDLLLELVKSEDMDITDIPIMSVIEQFMAVLENSERIDLSIAGEWLVMASHLLWLQSKLILSRDEPGGEAKEAVEDLARRLAELHRMRAGAVLLETQKQLGRDVFGRGEPELLVSHDRSGVRAGFHDLLRAYMSATKHVATQRVYRPTPKVFWTVQDALSRIGRVLPPVGELGWRLDDFVPAEVTDPLERRAAISATLIASLEMARGGDAELEQEALFSQITVSRAHRAEIDEVHELTFQDGPFPSPT